MASVSKARIITILKAPYLAKVYTSTVFDAIVSPTVYVQFTHNVINMTK